MICAKGRLASGGGVGTGSSQLSQLVPPLTCSQRLFPHIQHPHAPTHTPPNLHWTCPAAPLPTCLQRLPPPHSTIDTPHPTSNAPNPTCILLLTHLQALLPHSSHPHGPHPNHASPAPDLPRHSSAGIHLPKPQRSVGAALLRRQQYQPVPRRPCPRLCSRCL